jgi:hypothetical protein
MAWGREVRREGVRGDVGMGVMGGCRNVAMVCLWMCVYTHMYIYIYVDEHTSVNMCECMCVYVYSCE